MELKYEQEVDHCNLDDYSPKDREAFRWVFDDINHPNNFLPPIKITPERDKRDCGLWAVSFFDTIEQAKSRFKEITKDKTYLYKKLGQNVANGNLSVDDGISCDSNEQGHFDLHEYVGVDLSSKFAIVDSLI
ncbi:hypothetical protein [Gracilimonas sp.]|uniref:hypothetical protein n=1 Tax=Gracilimonas sp. TaxID=1974203 RepID=UPI0032EE4F3C